MFRKIVKDIGAYLPFFLRNIFLSIPVKYLLGKSYSVTVKEIHSFEKLDGDEKSSVLLEKLNETLKYAVENFDFYRELYKDHDILIKDWNSWRSLPTINKSDLTLLMNECVKGRVINTGGSTGEPASFRLDDKVWAREWAHMYSLWTNYGYSRQKTMLTCLGKDLGSNLLVYHLPHNEVRLNPYISWDGRANDIFSMIQDKSIEFIQIYPSQLLLLFDLFRKELKQSQQATIKKMNIKVLLSSEFTPTSTLNELKNFWNMEPVRWYGHSESCVWAPYNAEIQAYSPYHTYGLAECIEGELIGTSYKNSAMPLIRYRTGDMLSDVVFDNDLLSSFNLIDGRIGDFFINKYGNRVSATAFLFGKHHDIFNSVSSIQLAQFKPGELIVYLSGYTLTETPERLLINDKHEYFTYKFEHVPTPVLTPSGKMPLNITKFLSNDM